MLYRFPLPTYIPWKHRPTEGLWLKAVVLRRQAQAEGQDLTQVWEVSDLPLPESPSRASLETVTSRWFWWSVPVKLVQGFPSKSQAS